MLLFDVTLMLLLGNSSTEEKSAGGKSMQDTIMQIIGGGFYLLNKIFLSFAERSEVEETKRKWKMAAWSAFLIGLPPWLVLFYLNRNWIAGCLEAAGGPAMILGLLIAWRGKSETPKWLDYIALVMIPLGLGYSLYDFGGITTVNQVLEIGTAAGFLIGNYLLAKNIPSGYLWYMVMHIFAGLLMFQLSYVFLMVLQIISLGFILDAYWRQKNLGGK